MNPNNQLPKTRAPVRPYVPNQDRPRTPRSQHVVLHYVRLLCCSIGLDTTRVNERVEYILLYTYYSIAK
jgi:hypothetical protein